jgi:hypothetical protein
MLHGQRVESSITIPEELTNHPIDSRAQQEEGRTQPEYSRHDADVQIVKDNVEGECQSNGEQARIEKQLKSKAYFTNDGIHHSDGNRQMWRNEVSKKVFTVASTFT